MLTGWLQCASLPRGGPGRGGTLEWGPECVSPEAGLVVQQATSVLACGLTPIRPQDSSRAERPVVLAQLTPNCFASFLLFSFVVFLFVCVAVGPRAPGRMNF